MRSTRKFNWADKISKYKHQGLALLRPYTVNRGAFVHKNAGEQFEMRVHKRLIDIINPSPKLIEALTNLSLPSGIMIDVKML